MDSEFLKNSLLSGDGEKKFQTDVEQFEAIFPYYLSLGMTPEQFWQGDPELVRHYRKAEEIRVERRNQEQWMQGMYIYEALCDVAPIFRPFAKKGTKPNPYSHKPYPLKSQEKREEEQKDKKQMEKAMTMMDAFAAKINRNFKKKEVTANGRRSND